MKLEEKLKIKIEELQSEKYPYNDEYRFFEFLSERINSSKDLSEVSNRDYIMAIITLEGHKTFNQVIEAFEDFDVYLDPEPYSKDVDEDIVCFLTAIYGLKKVKLIDKVLEFEHQPTSRELDKILKKYSPEKDGIISGKKNPKLEVLSCALAIFTIGKDIFDELEEIKTFVRYVSECEDIDSKFTKFLNYKQDYEDYVFLKKNRSRLKEMEVIINGNEPQTVDDMLDTMEISNVLKQISDRYYELSKSKTQFTKVINKQIRLYNKMIEVMSSIENDKLISIKEDILSKLDDTELSSEFIKEILEHNRKVYSKLELENIKKDKNNKIEEMLWDNNIHIEGLREQEKRLLLKNINIETFNLILPYLKEPEFSWLNINHPNYVQIVLNTTPIILQTIISLIRNSVISKDFLKNNCEILIDEIKIPINDKDIENKYDLFRKNISLLVQNIDNLQQKISKNESIVFWNTEMLTKHLNLVKQYELNLSSENSKQYSLNILTDSDNFDDLDKFIELGYGEYIKQNPQLLREDSKDIITRLSIMTNIGLNSMNNDNRLKGSITNGKNFYVGQEHLKEFEITTADKYYKSKDFDILESKPRIIISDETKNLDIIEYLDNLFKANEQEYQINDIIISRNKVLRNIECLVTNKTEYDESSIALSAIIYHRVIDNNTIEFIKEKLNEYRKETVKKKTYNI